MRILTEDRITSLTGSDVSMYESTNTHGVDLMRNDYPTSQWVSHLPVSLQPLYDSNNVEIGKSAMVTFEFQGNPSFNGFYLGHFSCDALNFTVFEKTSSSTWNMIGTQQDVPVIVYPSFSSFVLGETIHNMDYMFSLKELNYTEEYLSKEFRVSANISTNVNQIEENQSPVFQMESIKSTAYSDTVDSASRAHWKIQGYFKDSSGSSIGVTSNQFKQKLEVGMMFLLAFPNDTQSSNQIYRLAQINSIRGSGSDSKAISMIIRSFEDDSATTKFESYLSAQGTTISGETDHNATAVISYALRSIRIGILRAGFIQDLPNPQVGLSRNYKDYSVKRELINGGHQYFNRNISRIYSGKLVLERSLAQTFMNFVRTQRGKPFAAEILTEMEEEGPSALYGFFNSTPSESLSHRTGALRDIDFSIQQVF